MTQLGNILEKLYITAAADKGVAKSKTLNHGLVIYVKINEQNMITLGIMRPNVYPSDQEWATVCEDWVYPQRLKSQLTPTREKTNSGFFLFSIFMYRMDLLKQ